MKCRAQTHLPRGLRFPVPLDKGNEGSGDEIVQDPPIWTEWKEDAQTGSFQLYNPTRLFSETEKHNQI